MGSNILILPGNAAPLSFTDDASPHLEKRVFKVSIHARVWRNSDLDWYFEILSLFKGVVGEIKSFDVLTAFLSFPGHSRRKIWRGLSKVPIHVVDPLHYQGRLRRILQRINKNTEDIESVLRTRAREGNKQAKAIVAKLDAFIVEGIINDSPGERLKRLADTVINQPFGPVPEELRQFYQPEIDSTPDTSAFVQKRGGAPDVRTATIFSSKSASAFTHIYDQFDSMDSLLAPSLLKFRLWYELAQAHAFDRGNDVIFGLIQRKRTEIAGMAEYPWAMSHPRADLEQFDSKDAFYGQAADIAAGFARVEFEKTGIRGVVARFEYVLLNGERADASALAKHDQLTSES